MLGASQKISNSLSARHSDRSETPGSAAVVQETGGGQQAAAGFRPDPDQIRRLLSSPEGQSLLRLMQSDGGAGLRAAAEAMRKGNVEGVKAALSPLLAGTEAEDLTRSLEAKL